MRFIVREARFLALLKSWSGRTPLIVVDYWFWANGSSIQRSLDGFYRTLLYRILSVTDESLCRTAFPDWQLSFSSKEPTVDVLAAAMDCVLKSAVRSTKFFFIIDGLDELHGSSIEKAHLANIVQELAAVPQVKLLLSSRPESAFLACFRGRPTLQLEKFTRLDITRFVRDSISAKGRDDDYRDEIRRIRSFIVFHARGVFLWVFLAVKIAIDGLNNYEDIRMIRQRIEGLPRELDDLFTDMLNRIPTRYKTEAFRYILIVLECQRVREYWPGLTAQSWDCVLVPDVALAVAQRASNHREAGNLAWLSPQEIRNVTRRLRSHLYSRCQGLLELSQRDMQNPAYAEPERRLSCVCFLHRTLFEYLIEHEEVIERLKSGAGSTFDLHRAMMTGWIAYHKVQPTTEALGKLTHVHMPIIFRLNALAERSTGRAQAKLLAAIDNDMRHRLEDIFPSRSGVGHWASEFVKDADLLAYTIATGSSHYLRAAINQHAVSTRSKMRPLLQFAVPHFSDIESRRTDAINFEAAALLLMHGENPLRDYHGHNSWKNAFTWITDNPKVIKSPTLPNTLKVIKLMAEYADDLRKCRATLVRNYTPAGVIRELVLEAICCGNMQVRVCPCTRARRVSIEADILLLILEPQPGVQSTLAANRTHIHVGSRESSRNRARGIPALIPSAGVHAYGHQDPKPDQSQRFTSRQRIPRSANRNVNRSQLHRSAEPSRESDIKKVVVALSHSQMTGEAGMHQVRHLQLAHREGPDRYWGNNEPYTCSRKASANIYTDRPTHNTCTDDLRGNVSIGYPEEPRQRTRHYRERGRVTASERRQTYGRVPPVRSSSEDRGRPPSSRIDQSGAPTLYYEQPGELVVRSKERPRSLWDHLKQFLLENLCAVG